MFGQVYQPPLDERVSLLSQFPHRFELLSAKIFIHSVETRL
jgi:hypothetical protein